MDQLLSQLIADVLERFFAGEATLNELERVMRFVFQQAHEWKARAKDE